jgi:hypothetical protein
LVIPRSRNPVVSGSGSTLTDQSSSQAARGSGAILAGVGTEGDGRYQESAPKATKGDPGGSPSVGRGDQDVVG